ncbi:hypothetical protein GYMLUDRAFT_248021 [Collybiopsis luxurians FD-317 M1]|uniref:Uncharacterized protein n=1 Tax=Collybiopsis luxurians FD-317 M1 TaxID=944289 RepID=A0A0D0C1S4_9AGAR|nr:hypothetical protein GYMLUDRAFT_248021 [Collybiopsis luxurians FD-317 M1]
MNVQHQLPQSRSAERQEMDEMSYKNTHMFLKGLAECGSPIAILAFKCLELNQSLGFCEAEMPWVVTPRGWMNPSVAILPTQAALTAHFCLAAPKNAASEPEMHFSIDGMNFELKLDNEKIQQVMKEVLKFLETLKNNYANAALDISEHDSAKAENLLVQLEEIPKFNLQINAKVIQVLFHDPRA